ncbi:MAG: site-specific DNA-methyltransferase [Bacteroidetes bacterium]|nr:site-specific DNA-methyltransferase [Bacteroidota bacterium]
MSDVFHVDEKRCIDEAVEELFNYFRNVGFPHYNIENYDSMLELEKLIKYNVTDLINGNDVKQTMHSLGFLWCFFPHWVDITYSNQNNSLIERWNDDNKLKSLLYKTYLWTLRHGNGVITENRVRQNAKVYCSKQSVSNFRPSAAKALYNRFGNEGVVWDMCAGWGGRLFGFLASDCEIYYANEPSTKTFRGLTNLCLEYYDEPTYLSDTESLFLGSSKTVQLFNEGCEIMSPPNNSVDLCFTSPPYFDTEHYSNEKTQSFIKYPSKKEWLNGFILTMIKNCYSSLKDKGYLILNISNTKNHQWIEDEVTKICEDNGFILIDTYYLILSSIAGKGVKREPIFIFQKEALK